MLLSTIVVPLFLLFFIIESKATKLRMIVSVCRLSAEDGQLIRVMWTEVHTTFDMSCTAGTQRAVAGCQREPWEPPGPAALVPGFSYPAIPIVADAGCRGSTNTAFSVLWWPATPPAHPSCQFTLRENRFTSHSQAPELTTSASDCFRAAAAFFAAAIRSRSALFMPK